MATIDYDSIINRIIAVIKSNSAIWDTGNPTGKLRSVQYGEDSYKIHDKPTAYALVTTPDRPFITGDRFGIGESSTDPQHTLHFLIRVFVKEGRPQKAEELLYGFIKEITDTLKANPRLKDPDTSTDPKCIRSYIDIPRLEQRGEEIQSIEIQLTCQIGDAIELVYDGTTVFVLEEVNSPHGWTVNQIPDDDGIIDVAPVMLEEKKFFKIETNPTLQSTLRSKIRSPGLKSCTITRNGTARNIANSMITRMTDLVVYDNIPQSVIELQIIRDTS